MIKQTTTSPLTLGADEIRMVMAWRRMDERHRYENLDLMELEAEKYPRRAAPALRLVSAGKAVPA